MTRGYYREPCGDYLYAPGRTDSTGSQIAYATSRHDALDSVRCCPVTETYLALCQSVTEGELPPEWAERLMFFAGVECAR